MDALDEREVETEIANLMLGRSASIVRDARVWLHIPPGSSVSAAVSLWI